MSRKSDQYLKGVPMKPYDLVREGVIALVIVAALIVVTYRLVFAPSRKGSAPVIMFKPAAPKPEDKSESEPARMR